MKDFTFYWLDGVRQVLQGNDPADAMNKAGYGQGAVRALDFYANGDNTDYVWNGDKREWDLTPEARKEKFGF